MCAWSEAELEDYVWEHKEFLNIENYEHVGRQVRLPNGYVIDILGRQEIDCGYRRAVVVELKAVEADGKALAQVWAYAQVLHEWMETRAEDCSLAIDPKCVLVAPSFEQKTLLAMQATRTKAVFAKLAWKPTFLNPKWVCDQSDGDADQCLFDQIGYCRLSADDDVQAVNDAVG